MKRSITVLAILALALILPACNTTKGLGADIEDAGGSIKHSAERNGAD